MAGAALPDYDFAGLNARTFEHLVQAIAIEIISPSVTVFGDGRDGGREATFDGSTKFESAATPWHGYGIIQAKFRQRPQGDSGSDGDWALKQLRDEIRAYDGPEMGRRQPEYYVFCTNVVLTPYPRAGGKDKIAEELNKWADAKGLKGWAIWDYDQLCTYLNTCSDVRRTFAAWTTPGDVLASIVNAIDGVRPDFADIAVRYLQKELRRDLYAKLEQAGHLNEEPVPLARIFTDLPVVDYGEPYDSFLISDGGSAEEDLSWFANELVINASVPLAKSRATDVAGEGRASARVGRTVLLGGPGQGKTTVGQYVCQIFRAAILNQIEPQRLDQQAADGLRMMKASLATANWELPGCKRFPIRLVLSEFAADLSRDQDLSIVQYVTRRLNVRTESTLDGADVHNFLQEYPFLIIFDGLDEVPPSSNRDRLLDAIYDFEADIAAKGMDAFLLVTTRPQGYSEELSPRFYRHRLLIPLPSTIALRYGVSLTKARYVDDIDRQSKIIQRLKLATEHEATSRLMESPLQVTIMVTLVDQFGRPPEERWDLFHQYYRLICRREIERDIDSSLVIREHQSNIDKLHQLVGLLLQSASERTGGTRSTLSLETFQELVHVVLEAEGFSSVRINAVGKAIVDAAAQRLVFLAGIEEGEVGFEIRSLQEFMAAESLLDGDDRIVRERLQSIAGTSNWRNVFLFAAGRIFKQTPHLRDALVQICTGLNDDPDDPENALLVSGSKLALSILQEGAARKSPRYAAQFTRLSLRLLGHPAYSVATELADVCTQDTADAVMFEIRNLLQRGTSLERTDAWRTFTRLVDHQLVDLDEWVRTLETTAILSDEEHCWAVAESSENSTEIRRILSLELFRFSPERVLQSGSVSRSRVGANRPRPVAILRDRSFWPAPLAEVIDSFARQEPEQISIKVSDELRLQQTSCAALGGESLIACELPNQRHAGWEFYFAVYEYRRTGRAAELADLVAAYCKTRPSGRAPSAAGPLPWPATACLGFAIDDEAGAAIEEALRRGKLGDLYEWSSWEESWRHEGFDVGLLEPCSDPQFPFESGNWSVAPLVSVTSYVVLGGTDGPMWTYFLSSVNRAKKFSSRLARSQIASFGLIAHFYLAVLDDPEESVQPAIPKEVVEALLASSSTAEWADVSVLGALAQVCADADTMELFVQLVASEALASFPSARDFPFTEDMLREFMFCFLKRPSLVGLLMPIALRMAASPTKAAAVDVDMIERLAGDADPIYLEAVSLLMRAAQGDLSEQDAPAIQRQMLTGFSSILDLVVEALISTGQVVQASRILVRLARDSTEHNEIEQAAFRALAEVVERRTSGLDVDREWLRLGLPGEVLALGRQIADRTG